MILCLSLSEKDTVLSIGNAAAAASGEGVEERALAHPAELLAQIDAVALQPPDDVLRALHLVQSVREMLLHPCSPPVTAPSFQGSWCGEPRAEADVEVNAAGNGVPNPDLSCPSWCSAARGGHGG